MADGTLATLHRVKEISSVEDFNAEIQKDTLVVVDFSADWCGPSHMIRPLFERLSKQYEQAIFIRIDETDPNVGPIFEEYEIDSFPTFKFFCNGAEVGQELPGANEELLRKAVKNNSHHCKRLKFFPGVGHQLLTSDGEISDRDGERPNPWTDEDFLREKGMSVSCSPNPPELKEGSEDTCVSADNVMHLNRETIPINRDTDAEFSLKLTAHNFRGRSSFVNEYTTGERIVHTSDVIACKNVGSKRSLTNHLEQFFPNVRLEGHKNIWTNRHLCIMVNQTPEANKKIMVDSVLHCQGTFEKTVVREGLLSLLQQRMESGEETFSATDDSKERETSDEAQNREQFDRALSALSQGKFVDLNMLVGQCTEVLMKSVEPETDVDEKEMGVSDVNDVPSYQRFATELRNMIALKRPVLEAVLLERFRDKGPGGLGIHPKGKRVSKKKLLKWLCSDAIPQFVLVKLVEEISNTETFVIATHLTEDEPALNMSNLEFRREEIRSLLDKSGVVQTWIREHRQDFHKEKPNVFVLGAGVLGDLNFRNLLDGCMSEGSECNVRNTNVERSFFENIVKGCIRRPSKLEFVTEVNVTRHPSAFKLEGIQAETVSLLEGDEEEDSPWILQSMLSLPDTRRVKWLQNRINKNNFAVYDFASASAVPVVIEVGYRKIAEFDGTVRDDRSEPTSAQMDAPRPSSPEAESQPRVVNNLDYATATQVAGCSVCCEEFVVESGENRQIRKCNAQCQCNECDGNHVFDCTNNPDHFVTDTRGILTEWGLGQYSERFEEHGLYESIDWLWVEEDFLRQALGMKGDDLNRFKAFRRDSSRINEPNEMTEDERRFHWEKLLRAWRMENYRNTLEEQKLTDVDYWPCLNKLSPAIREAVGMSMGDALRFCRRCKMLEQLLQQRPRSDEHLGTNEVHESKEELKEQPDYDFSAENKPIFDEETWRKHFDEWGLPEFADIIIEAFSDDFAGLYTELNDVEFWIEEIGMKLGDYVKLQTNMRKIPDEPPKPWTPFDDRPDFKTRKVELSILEEPLRCEKARTVMHFGDPICEHFEKEKVGALCNELDECYLDEIRLCKREAEYLKQLLAFYHQSDFLSMYHMSNEKYGNELSKENEKNPDMWQECLKQLNKLAEKNRCHACTQPFDCLVNLYPPASICQNILREALVEFVKGLPEMNPEVNARAGQKSLYRCIQKMAFKRPNHPGVDYTCRHDLWDISRAMLIFDKIEDLTDAAGAFVEQEHINIINFDQRFTKQREDKWQCVMIHVKFPNNEFSTHAEIVSEIQFCLRSLCEVRSKGDGHHAYELFRAVDQFVWCLKSEDDETFTNNLAKIDHMLKNA